MSIADKIKKYLSEKRNKSCLLASAPVVSMPFVNSITQQEYSALSYEECKKQKLLCLKLHEISYIPMLLNLRRVVDEMIRGGIILQEDERAGFKILPIIGEQYFTQKRYAELKKTILDDERMMSAMKEKLKTLSACWNKTMYSICCENRKASCDVVRNECYLSKCTLAVEKFEEVTKMSYENLQKKGTTKIAGES